MYNWSTDEKKIKKEEEKYIIWRLEQVVNFGLSEKKIKKDELKKYWKKISIDPARRKFLSLFFHK